MNKKGTILITSFRGISTGARHYYGRLSVLNVDEIELFRTITQEEIDKFPNRFYSYKDGELINAFDTWKDVLIAGKIKAEEIGIDLSNLTVIGIPNTPKLSYFDAIKPLDTRPKCKKCGKIIEPGKGCYNTPRGLFCIDCYK